MEFFGDFGDGGRSGGCGVVRLGYYEDVQFTSGGFDGSDDAFGGSVRVKRVYGDGSGSRGDGAGGVGRGVRGGVFGGGGVGVGGGGGGGGGGVSGVGGGGGGVG